MVAKSSAIVILEDREGRIAMQHRDDKPGLFGRNQWGLFGGGIEDGETPVAGAVREIREELCISLDPDALRLLKTTPKEGGATRHWFAYPVADELASAVLMEGQDWRVMTRREVEQVDVQPHHLELLRWYWAETRGQ